jgi:hypothetical protein
MWRVPANDHANGLIPVGSKRLGDVPASKYGYAQPDHHANATSSISHLGEPRIERITTLKHGYFGDTSGAFFSSRNSSILLMLLVEMYIGLQQLGTHAFKRLDLFVLVVRLPRMEKLAWLLRDNLYFRVRRFNRI